jgi:hypothetical protein
MASSLSSGPHAARIVTLKGQGDYVRWFRDLKPVAESRNLWSLLSGDEKVVECPHRPIKPQTATISPRTTGSQAKPRRPPFPDLNHLTRTLRIVLPFPPDHQKHTRKRSRTSSSPLSTIALISTNMRNKILVSARPKAFWQCRSSLPSGVSLQISPTLIRLSWRSDQFAK